jgi:4-diphosphocytidyl-2-C-methyl-D-erythritol kinase
MFGVTAHLTETARAKINLTLRVIGRRADGYHDLESLVAFADVVDTLMLEPGADLGLEISGPFAAASGDIADNLVLKAEAALRTRVAGLKAGHFALEKNLPVAAGIGGGSADAAAALRLLARVNGLAFDDARLMTAALAVGADVPVCLSSRACVMTGVGERLTPPLHLPRLSAVLVNPGMPLATRDVFSAYAGRAAAMPSLGNVPRQPGALIEFLKTHGNDLTEAAIVRAPVVGEVLNALAALPGVQLARMSGSGSTCFALLASDDDAAAAARRLSAERQDWWVMATNVG